MKSETLKDLQRLMFYGAMYNAPNGTGMQPTDIENALAAMAGDSGFTQIMSTYTKGNQADQAAAISATQTVFNTVSTVVPVVGSVIGVIGGIVNAIQAANYGKDCDDSKNLPDYPDGHYNNKQMNLRVLTSYNAPDTVSRSQFKGYEHDLSQCIVKGWGATNKLPESRWGMIAQYTNDGAWVWKQPGGTVIGVHAIWDTGPLANCWVSMARNPVSPRLTGAIDPDVPKRLKVHRAGTSDTYSVDVPNHVQTLEYQRRGLGVLLYLKWLRSYMSYGTLSCMENLLKGEKGVGGNTLICRDLEKCLDKDLVQYSGATSFEIPDDIAKRRQHASRFYNSIRSMFHAFVAQAKIIGVGKVAQKIRDLRIQNGNRIANAVEGKKNTLEGGIKSESIEKELKAWPEWYIAKEMNWSTLKYMLNWEASEIATEIQRQMTSYNSSSGNIGRLIVKAPQPLAQLQALPAPNRTIGSFRLPSTPVLVFGGIAAGIGVYLLWKSYADNKTKNPEDLEADEAEWWSWK